jgi:hypothetical protein
MGVGNNDAANFLADQLGTVPVPDRDIDAGWTYDMALEQRTRLKNDIATFTSKAKPRKSGARKSTKQKSSRLKRSSKR